MTPRLLIALLSLPAVSAGPSAGNTIHVPQDYPTIQAAINAAAQLDMIVVDPGTYFERINFIGKLVTVTSIDPGDPAVVASTVIDGQALGTVVTFTGIEDERAVLAGFTITNGDAIDGGGVHGHGSVATIDRCLIVGNTAANGGAVFDADGVIIQCTIADNNATWGGGLMGCDGEVNNCTISNNSALSNGGGGFQCDGTIRWTVFAGNSAGAGGALSDSYALIENCHITQNAAGAGSGLQACNRAIVSCLIDDNDGKAPPFGASVYNCAGVILGCSVIGNASGGLTYCGGQITNCIIWDNMGGQVVGSSNPTYSCITGGSAGTGNIGDNPLFIVPGYWDWENGGTWVSGNYHLSQSSPCVDTGDPSYAPPPDATDFDGNPRVVNGRVDMGTFEYQLTGCEDDFDGDGTPDCFDLDIDGDGVPNGPDECDRTPLGTPVDADGRSLGDIDRDCDTDLDDFALFQLGFTGLGL